jgi:ABC-type uncharacterized transport system auxiliary subunit
MGVESYPSWKSTETVTAAFDASLIDVMRRVVDWTLQQGSAAAPTI